MIDDDCEFDTINPDDFLNESFLNDCLQPSRYDTRKSTSSESSCSFENICNPQLTPPISPQPKIIENNLYRGIQIIPINAIPSQIPRQELRKVIPIVPKPIKSNNGSSSESESKVNFPTDKALIKQARLIRNRESALMSRRKKKEYLQSLESEVHSLRRENVILREENSLLKSKLKEYGNFTCRCASTLSAKLPNKNASLMLALVFMICINFIPLLGNIFLTNRVQNYAASGSPSLFTARRLLYSNVTTENYTNSSDTESEKNIPLYINQTDLIRKANIENIRSWIPQPDLFNVSSISNDELFADPLQNKLARMHEKSRDQIMKHNIRKSRKKAQKKNKSSNERKLGGSNLHFYDTSFFKLNEFFEEINRKDDTFYLFSFKADHLLLPANDYPQNFSQIIKMNLIMPRSNNGKFNKFKLNFLKFFG